MTDTKFRPFDRSDTDWVIERHRNLYTRDEGFDASFGVLVEDVVTAFASEHDPMRERGFIAMRGADRIGSIFATRSNHPNIAKLRLFLVLPEARRQGVGFRLLEAALGFARGAGYRELHVATYREHWAACALYAANGFVCTDSRPTHAFGKNLVEQCWERAL